MQYEMHLMHLGFRVLKGFKPACAARQFDARQPDSLELSSVHNGGISV